MKNFIFTKEKKMNTILASLTIVALAICGPNKHILEENLKIEKPTNIENSQPIIYKKVPTKWVKITKKSN